MKLLVFTLAANLLALAAPRMLRPEDTLALWSIGEIAASPGSATVLYSVSRPDLTSNKTQREWRISGGGVAPLPAGASEVRWSPDGQHIAFVQGGSLWTMEWRTSIAVKLCDFHESNSYLANAGNSLAWSPDGRWLAFTGTLEPPPATPSDPVVITRILYKTRTAISDNRRTHIYLISADGGAPRLLTPGPHDEHSIDWRAGEEIVFLSNHEPDPDARLNYDIFAVHPATGRIRQITKTPGVEMNPRISPDGKSVAYTATTRRITTIDSIAEDDHVWTVPLAGGTAQELNPTLDRRTSGVMWTAKGEVTYTAQDHGRTLLLRGKERLLQNEAMLGDPSEHAGRFYFAYGDALHPREVWSWGAGELRQESHLNDTIVAEWQLSKPEHLSFRSFDGTPVEGWLYPPLATTSKYPVVLTIHGGPHGMFGYNFNAATHYAAGRGYGTLIINPRGSSGYGQKFADGCVNNWGGGDYKDLMAGVDHLMKTHQQADAGQLFVTGGSYGGFMTNWIVTQTKRFRAAVAAASVSNLISFYATSLYQDLIHAEFNGYPWEGDNFTTLWSWSPLKYIRNARTPLLLLHGENDNDVHITQAEEMYTALRHRGVEAVLVRYPGEGHGFREPKHQLDMLQRRIDWFDKHRP